MCHSKFKQRGCRDLPQALPDIGGWPNETLADNFARYARVLYTEFGDLVTDWITFNGENLQQTK
jgi:beta-glucosidase/6-phospho-beta-glucosidase/beta-galactosidase